MNILVHSVFAALFVLPTFAAQATAMSVHLGFSTYDPVRKIFGQEIYNPRLPNGDPRPLWVPSGTSVAAYVYVDFDRGGLQTVH